MSSGRTIWLPSSLHPLPGWFNHDLLTLSPTGQQWRELGIFLPASAPPALLGLATTGSRIPGLEGL